MTLYAWARPRRFPELPAPEARLFDVAPDTRVLAHCHWQPARDRAVTLLLLHGLEGSSDGHYMRGLAEKAWRRGFNIVRLNQRNCGGTEHLSRGLYHSGLTADPRAVMEELATRDGLARVAIAGYSLGGNLALKIAGELGGAHGGRLLAVAAVSPVMELGVCVEALERRENALYQWHFVHHLKGRLRRKARAFPGDWDLGPLATLRTVREFDERYTAPHHGFTSAADYYHRASARRVLEHIQVPALILTAADDPFVPPAPFRDPVVAAHPHVTTVITEHGGHCGFVGAPEGDDGYWAERTVVEWIAECRLQIAD
ncbi:MAG: alpha/beta fold hydrolase [Vicinamibacterales bacterium]|nr:alpha/beta fold hydrolase [Vicinamibacterales bacterium]